MITDFITSLESAHTKSITPTAAAQDDWVEMVDKINNYTLLPLTNSWWTGANIPGKKVQMLTYVGGIQQYEAQCREMLNNLKGFEVVYEDGKKRIDEEMPIKTPVAA